MGGTEVSLVGIDGFGADLHLSARSTSLLAPLHDPALLAGHFNKTVKVLLGMEW
jgi:hypothetical protein